MPELPEVETIRRGLARRLLGARIEDVVVRDRRLRQSVSVAALRRLVGSRLQSIDRRAKYLVMGNDGGATLIVHLGMSGRLLLHEGAARSVEPHDHISWWLSPLADAKARVELRYHDPRRFGMVLVVPTTAIEAHRLFASLGREPLVDADAVYLAARARGSKRAVKTFLMDASVVVGIGNIYASETLWYARVHPATPCGRIGARRWQRIVDSMRHVLESAIDAGGTTLADYRDPAGNLGYFGAELRVYGRQGDRCRRCSGSIRRRVDAGRSTYFCATCQR